MILQVVVQKVQVQDQGQGQNLGLDQNLDRGQNQDPDQSQSLNQEADPILQNQGHHPQGQDQGLLCQSLLLKVLLL